MKFGVGLSAALALLLSGAVLAVPNKPIEKTIRVPIANKGWRYRQNTVAEWTYTLQKYGFTKAATGLRAQAVAKVPLVDLGLDREYYGLIDIGTPAQTLKVMMDTGSPRLIISSSECPSCTGKTHFKSQDSSTYQSTSSPWSTSLRGTSSASGVIGYDVVNLGGIAIQNQTIHLARQMTPKYDEFIDGVLGLSFGARINTTTVLESMIAQNLIDKGIVSFALGKQSESGGGEVLFGGIDSKVADGGNITYTDVISDNSWAVNIQGIMVNGQSVQLRGENITIFSVMDTGSALLTLPTSIASAIHKIIPRSIRLHEVWYIPCVGTLTLEFAIEGVKFAIPYSDLARENSALADFCHSAVQTNPGDFAIIGDVFFKNSYVIFDEDNRKMGFAPLVPQ